MAGKKKEPAEVPGKVRIEVRFDADLAERVQKLADDSGMSVNQLMQGITRAVLDKSHVGEVDVDERNGEVSSGARTPGCMWVGEEASIYEFEGRTEMTLGWVWFWLDYSERRAVGYPDRVKEIGTLMKGVKE